MFKKVLLAVDGSAEAEKVITWAQNAFDAHPETQFTFMYVHQPHLVAQPIGYMPVEYETFDFRMPDVTPAQEAAEQLIKHERVSFLNKTGIPSDLLCKVAEEGGYDVIVLGARGHGIVSSVLLGSVSAKVLHHSPCSVLVVR